MNGAYVFHEGYWAAHVGFYGGINYGGGYFGAGFVGARWVNNQVHYNTAVTNVHVTNIHNVYHETIINNVTVVNNNTVNNTHVTNVSYAGGAGGSSAAPTAAERVAEREPHVAATQEQQHHEEQARHNLELLADRNHGRPPVAATTRVGAPFVEPTHAAPTSASAVPADLHRSESGANTSATSKQSERPQAPGPAPGIENHPHSERSGLDHSEPVATTPPKKAPSQDTKAQRLPAQSNGAPKSRPHPQNPRPRGQEHEHDRNNGDAKQRRDQRES